MDSQDNQNQDNIGQAFNDFPTDEQSEVIEEEILDPQQSAYEELGKANENSQTDRGEHHNSGQSSEDQELDEFEDADMQLPVGFKEQLNGQSAYLVDADEVHLPELDEVLYSEQYVAACEVMDSIESSILVVYGEAYVEDVSLSIATRVEQEFSSLFPGKLHFRDIPQDDVLLHSPVDELLELFERELKQGDNIRVNIQLNSHPKLCRWLIAKENFERLNTLITNREAYLLVCIYREQYSIEKSLDSKLSAMAESIYIDWTTILVNKWHDAINLESKSKQYLLGLFPKNRSNWLNKAPRAAAFLCSQAIESTAEKSDEEKTNHIKSLIQKAFQDSQKKESQQLKQIVEQGWQKPLKKMLLAIYCCLSERQPVRYKELRAWGYCFLQQKCVRYPVIQQRTHEQSEVSNAALGESPTTIKSDHQYVDTDASALWLEYFDELIDNCNLSIERTSEYGLTIGVVNLSEDWLVEEFYRRYPSMTQEIYDYIIDRNMLFPGPEGSSAPSISESNGFSHLLMCVNRFNSVDFPISTTLFLLLEKGTQVVIARERYIRANTNGNLSRTKSENILNYVSSGIAYYIQAIQRSSVSQEEYKLFLSESLNATKGDHLKTKLLINAFGLLAVQKKFATLDYMFEFLRFSQKQSISEAAKCWLNMRRVFAYHMSASLTERCRVLEQMGDMTKKQEEEGIIHMTYSRLWFDAIRSDFSNYSSNVKGSFSEVIAKKDYQEISRLLSYYKMVNTELVSFSVRSQYLVQYIANMMLSGLQSALGDTMTSTFETLHLKLSEILFTEYLVQVAQKQHARYSQNPLVLMKQYKQISQVKAHDKLNATKQKVYVQYFSTALAEWGSGAAGLNKDHSTQESLDILTVYLETLDETFEPESIHQICAHWKSTASVLEQLERETSRPDGANHHLEVIYLELKKLMRFKVNRYRKMAEYLGGLQQKTGKEITR
ncbi:hypothetical protein [Photobacterium kasasachensis]|uniref:hypothetical protein n=1 Tax=Photobacterium kasasachensis TaxID=2910240 RepID=UPI003D14CA6D